VNVKELFEALVGLTGARTVPAPGDGLAESVLVAGIEVARSDDPDERSLRRAWRERARGGPTPLVVLADDPEAESCARAFGPSAEGGRVRVVPTDTLLRALERLPAARSVLMAVRDLAEELARLDRAAAPRMGQPGWFPDEDAIRRAEFRATTPAERVAEAISISRTATKIAAAADRQRER
jgi:hypothetical protein